MSDFILSTNNVEQNEITKQIQSIYHDKCANVKEFHGEWGSLGVSQNLYHGFEPYEDDQFIAIVIGGPLLTYQNNSFLSKKDSSEGTKSIFQRWKSNKIEWDNDLSGPFTVLIVNKKTKIITCVTDLMSFIPVYSYEYIGTIILGTHVDLLAGIAKQNNDLDEVSIADFILHGIITYPFTIYSDIFQVAPASEHKVMQNPVNLNHKNYWLPVEENKYKSINEAVKELRESLQKNVDSITKSTKNIAQFISGGEDSRTLSGLLRNQSRDGFVFLDHMNREGKIAEKVAEKYGVTFKLATRQKLHYLNILSSCSDLVGSGSQYFHAHTYGFHESCNLQKYSAVFGGLFSDALLKGARIKKVRRSGRIPFWPEVKQKSYLPSKELRNDVFSPNILSKITKRRRDHFNYVKEFREESSEEWFELWPSSMNKNIPNIHANRRLFRSYEPFMSKDVVKISASVPQKWKLNRKLFHPTVKPYLKQSKWILHSNGWLPYFPWYINSFVGFTTSLYRKFANKVGLIKGNQGPWNEWNDIVNSKEWNQKLSGYLDELFTENRALSQRRLKELIESEKLSNIEYVNLTQVIYQLSDKK